MGFALPRFKLRSNLGTERVRIHYSKNIPIEGSLVTREYMTTTLAVKTENRCSLGGCYSSFGIKDNALL